MRQSRRVIPSAAKSVSISSERRRSTSFSQKPKGRSVRGGCLGPLGVVGAVGLIGVDLIGGHGVAFLGAPVGCPARVARSRCCMSSDMYMYNDMYDPASSSRSRRILRFGRLRRLRRLRPLRPSLRPIPPIRSRAIPSPRSRPPSAPSAGEGRVAPSGPVRSAGGRGSGAGDRAGRAGGADRRPGTIAHGGPFGDEAHQGPPRARRTRPARRWPRPGRGRVRRSRRSRRSRRDAGARRAREPRASSVSDLAAAIGVDGRAPAGWCRRPSTRATSGSVVDPADARRSIPSSSPRPDAPPSRPSSTTGAGRSSWRSPTSRPPSARSSPAC